MGKAKKKIYTIRPGSVVGEKDIQTVGETIEVLINSLGGVVTPRDVIYSAKEKSSPIHKYFEWDDTIAGEKYREVQARKLLGSVVEVVTINREKQTHRSFYNVKNSDGNPVYVTLQKAISTPDYIVDVVERAQMNIKALNNTLGLFIQNYKKK